MNKERTRFHKEQRHTPEERKQALLERLSALEALVSMTEKKNIIEVLSILQGSTDSQEAREKLQRRYQLTEDQAQAIIDLRLRAALKFEREKLEAEYQELRARMNRMESADFSKMQPGTATYITARENDVFRGYMAKLAEDQIYLHRKVLYFSLATEQKALVEKFKLRNENLSIDDMPGETIEKIERKISRFARNNRKYGDIVVMVDYLPLISSKYMRQKTRVEELIYISEKLYGLAKELNLILLVAAPLERHPVSKERKDKWLLEEFKAYGREFDVEKVSDHLILVEE